MIARNLSSPVALALAGLALAAAAPASAQSRSVDDRLKEKGIAFEVDEDGDYKLGISWSNEGRSQIVFISGRTEEVGGMTVREVFAPAAIVKDHDITGAKALELLEASGKTKLGSWEIRGGVVYYVAKVFDSISASQLETVIAIVSESADDKEIELTGGKDDL
ncbi:MAG: hypothetical protein NBV60_01900 [Erythrobacter sp.]|nr:hypothetical protein [Erythrobacter sp.]